MAHHLLCILSSYLIFATLAPTNLNFNLCRMIFEFIFWYLIFDILPSGQSSVSEHDIFESALNI